MAYDEMGVPTEDDQYGYDSVEYDPNAYAPAPAGGEYDLNYVDDDSAGDYDVAYAGQGYDDTYAEGTASYQTDAYAGDEGYDYGDGATEAQGVFYDDGTVGSAADSASQDPYAYGDADDAYGTYDAGPGVYPPEPPAAPQVPPVPPAPPLVVGGTPEAVAEGVGYDEAAEAQGAPMHGESAPVASGASVADILAGTVDVAPYVESTAPRPIFRSRSNAPGENDAGTTTQMPGAEADYVPITRITTPVADGPDEMDAESEAALVALEERRAKRRRRRTIIIAVVAVVLLAVGGAAAFLMLTRGGAGASSPESAEALPPATATVTRENFTSTVTTQGALQPIASETVVPTVDGTVSEIFVAEGDVVVSGDELFTVRNETLEKAVTDATTQLNTANSAAQRASATATQAYNDYNAAVAAYNAGTIDITQIAAYEAAVRSANSARDEANNAVTAAQRALDDANAALSKCTVLAPMSGTVVAINRDVDSKGTSSPSTANMSIQIADLDRMKVVVQVNEMDISSITAGQTASATFSALPDLKLNATVESVATAATGDVSGGGSGGGIVTFGVTLVIDSPDPELKPGMTANVTITTQDVPNALVVPLSAVSVDAEDTGMGTVWLVSDPDTYESVPRTVRLGARDTTRVVVTSGLKEGDTILLTSSGDGAAADAGDGTRPTVGGGTTSDATTGDVYMVEETSYEA